MLLKSSLYWQNSNNQELIDAVHEYWQGQPSLSESQIKILRDYLYQWIQEVSTDYPQKEQHLTQAMACERIEDLKVLTNRLLDWGIDPW